MLVVRGREIDEPGRGSMTSRRDLLWHVPAVIWQGDQASRRLSLSPHWERITGQRTRLALAHGYLERIHPLDRPRIPIATAHLFETGEAYEIEYRIMVRDGSYRWQVERAVLDVDDGIAVGTVFDVHDRGPIEHEPTRIATMQERMVSVVSHDLRSPLTTVRTALEVLKDQVEEPTPAVQALLHHLESAARRADHMVASLMEFAREGPDGTLPVHLEDKDLIPVVLELVEEARVRAEDRLIEFKAPEDPVRARIDEERLAQALGNLVNNALEHASGPVGVEIRSTPTLEIRVLSNGPRLSGHQLKTLYEPFHESSGHGLGLGLWIARQVALAHGGHLHHHYLDERNVFVIGLPALDEDAAPDTGPDIGPDDASHDV